MYGVVLWSDTEDQKAVIWCEDHGDLAFYRQPCDGQQVCLDAGDWIQFDMTTERHLRLAHNPRLVADGAFSELAGAVETAAQPYQQSIGVRSVSVPQASRGSADIIPFAPRASGHAARFSEAVLHGA
ncbi:hypothetical protein LCL97_05735 [Seohaeicola saemankumensis]|nr:hypothetical protein [Seohaeicola saemankumensis]MCA0870314.1 hypothetical protein [Seohaeicola saemankumensis]